ncbi:ATP-binding cassette domain-containing protein [Acrocarpospora macrocephala]|uniref:ABC transporter n=1 Tax=Acrocarpospora macrocephala TaxID=150177 RepID=A0A5M3X5S1_9ACTN|nr:ABC transporter ATP-binding protein [Acrocarpospora macrocephala]GES14233.1 ABC transporter [Acrocarpospora macrocephala]
MARLNPLILATGLEKTYPARDRKGAPFRAVAGVDFQVHRGEAFGFLGPNGAGKSSTMRMLGGVSAPTAGSLRILGLDPVADGRRVRARLGVVPQDDSLDTQLTVEENLVVYGLYFGLSRRAVKARAGELLEFARLEDKAGERVEHLSGGMRRRLTIARALINEPEILLLDEPTTGLDPQARHVLWDRLFRLKQDGVTLILTTHYMDEAEQLCDRLVVMDKGLIADEGSPRELIERHVTREVLELRFPPGENEEVARKVGDHVEVLPDRLLWYADDGEQALAQATEAGVRPLTALVRRASLEDVFLRLTGRSLTD